MRIVLTSFGSTGDIQPLLALALEFLKHGHKPVLALSPNFAPRARQLGIEFAPLGPELDPALIRGVGTALVKDNDPAAQVRHFIDAVIPPASQMFRELLTLCQTADALVSSPFQIVGRMVHDKLGVPFVSIHLSQFGALGTKIVRDVSAPPINRCRTEEGLMPLDDPLSRDGASPDLALYAVSQLVLKAPANWPEHHRVVGFFFLDETGWIPPAELCEFIESGDAPLVFSFGSMIHEAPDSVTDLIVETVARTGRRAILQEGWSGLGRRPMPPNIFRAAFTPHSWLFPRAACVIHHGGAGTTAATFKAGVPAVVVPHTLDQPIWGAFAKALGCAGAVISFARLTADGLGQAIVETLNSPRHRAAAVSVSAAIESEQGCRAARGLIEELVSAAKMRCRPRMGETSLHHPDL